MTVSYDLCSALSKSLAKSIEWTTVKSKVLSVQEMMLVGMAGDCVQMNAESIQ